LLVRCFDGDLPSDPFTKRFWDLVRDIHHLELERQLRRRDQVAQEVLSGLEHDLADPIARLEMALSDARDRGVPVPPTIEEASYDVISGYDLAEGVDAEVPGIASFDLIQENLNHAIRRARTRAVHKAKATRPGLDSKKILQALRVFEGLAEATPPQRQLVRLLGNILANAALSAAECNGAVEVELAAHAVAFKNRALKSRWEPAAEFLNSEAPKGTEGQEGLTDIKQLASLLHLSLRAGVATSDSMYCTASVMLSTEVQREE